MRDLLFKNLTSQDKRRKRIASLEILDKQGMRSVIRRHFVCIIKEIKRPNPQQPLPYVYILKQRNTKEQKEKFYCRIKGSVYALSKDKLFLILFTHSLRINLEAIPEGAMKYTEEEKK